MSQDSFQILEIAVLSVVFITLVVVLARRQMLTFRYAFGWFVVFFISGTAGLFVPLVEPIADVLQVAPSMVFVGLVIVALLLISIQLSISISGLQRKLQDLAEKVALMQRQDQRDQQSRT